MRFRNRCAALWSALALLGVQGAALAQDAGGAKVDTGDTAFMLLCSALVLLMTPGLALFYGGMVRRKNALGTIMQSFIAMGVISVMWVLYGYSLAFGPSHGGIIGGPEWLGLRGVGQEPHAVYGSTIPLQAHMAFQMMFAIITPALISGAFAERMKFKTYLVFILLWGTLVYVPLAHWVWADGGWLARLGALDFAGGTVVHISSGITALVCALVMGKRKGYPGEEFRPHNLTMTLLGTGLLWFGWFGFNAGSALAANGIAATAFVTTNTAAAAAALAWMFAEWAHRGEPTALGAASGAVAGLVGVTPAAGFVSPMAAIVIGAGAGLLCYGAVVLKTKLGYDDSLDTFGVHGVGGTWGAVATGLFAATAVNSAVTNQGLFLGGTLVGTQLVGVGATILYAGVVSFVLLKILDATMGLRVKEHAEEDGLDLTQHGEAAYHM
jgi:Amt family ammonium transporter